MMLTPEEEQFLLWWEANRERHKKKKLRFFIGLPTGLILGLPVLLSVFARWNKYAFAITDGQMIVLLIAVMAIISFVSVFSVQHKWEMREQIYQELQQKKRAAMPSTDSPGSTQK